MTWRLVLGVAAFAVLGGAALFFLKTPDTNSFSPNPVFSEELKTIRAEDTLIRVAVADTAEERMQGLSGTTSLPPETGLLFVFESDTRPDFWMKDMLFPIDIIWISSEGEVTGVEENVSPNTFPATFSPAEDIRYVLEVPAGFTDDHKIQKSSRISVEMAL